MDSIEALKQCFFLKELFVSQDMRGKLRVTDHATLLSVFFSCSSSPFLIIPNTLLLLKGKQEF